MASILQLIEKELPQINSSEVAALIAQKKDEYLAEQDKDKQEANLFGIGGTPGFVIGNRGFSGAYPANVFTQLIEEELAR